MKFKDLSYKVKYQFVLRCLFITLSVSASFIGGMMNGVAVMYNNGMMPVLHEEKFFDAQHFSFVDCSTVNFCLLTDMYKINNTIYSIGDFLIFLGFILTVVFSINLIYFATKIYIRQRKERFKKIKYIK